MQPTPAIAVLTSNILVGAGLRSMLEKMVPQASVELLRTFEAYLEAGPDRYVHCFVAAPVFRAHSAFFRERCHRTIVLTHGSPCPGMHALDVDTDEEEFVHALVRMLQHVRRPEHTLRTRNRGADAHRPRADQQGDRRPAGYRADDGHLPPPQHHGETRHPLGGRAGRLCADLRAGRRRRDLTRERGATAADNRRRNRPSRQEPHNRPLQPSSRLTAATKPTTGPLAGRQRADSAPAAHHRILKQPAPHKLGLQLSPEKR